MVKSFFTMLVFLWTLILLVYIAEAQGWSGEEFGPAGLCYEYSEGINECYLPHPKPPSVTTVATTTVEDYVPDEVLVRFKAGVSQEELDTAKTNCYIKYNSKHEAISTWNFKITDGKDPKDTVECLSREPAVMQAEPNYIAPLPGKTEETK